jgi:chromate transport protein ChrA
MFSFVSQFLQRFHSKPIVSILMLALLALVSTVILVSLMRWLRRRRQDRPESWVGLITGSVGNVFKTLAAIVVVAGLCLHLWFQSGEFARSHGGVSERNYNAVQQIWGKPHIQNELSVSLFTTSQKFYDKDGLEFDPVKLKATTQLVAYRTQDIETPVSGNTVVEAKHDLVLTTNYRRKGSAWYPGFEIDGHFTYVVQNPADHPVKARFTFPLSPGQGMVENLTVTANGKLMNDQMNISGDSLNWTMDLAKGQTLPLEISYRSRGLDYICIQPGQGREFKKYRVSLTCHGIKLDDVNSPIGCMTPTSKKALPDGMVLEWNLEHAVTRLGMGQIVPKAKQDGYYVARALSAAPWAMVLLLIMLIVTSLTTGREIAYVPTLLVALAFHLYYLLMANIGDYWPGLTGGMIIAGLVLTGLVALLKFRTTDRFAAWSGVAFFAVFCFAYPLISISDYQNLLLSILYVVLLAYVIVLLVTPRLRKSGD